MEWIGIIVLIVYCLALLYITLFCLLQFQLLYLYRKSKASPGERDRTDHLEYYPMVTVQLPVYNERYVVGRLIDNICKLNYPQEKLQIQVLDDSTDDTLSISREKVNHYCHEGYNIELITRKRRDGYKAGALHHGLRTAQGKYIAIFDADFLPQPDFLVRTIPYFNNPAVGVVQTRWEHINPDYSLITRVQAFQLNVHFTVEQGGRQQGDYMLQFNGTAGIWRREAIESSGGWKADTLTEDLDLSYRAQLNGWQIRYLESVASPAELPAEMNGLKSQQFRWMKGGAETARKLLPAIWKSNLARGKKIHATMHLLSSTIFVFVFIVGVFSVPLAFLVQPLGIDVKWFTFFLIGLLSIALVYYVANYQSSWQGYSFGRAAVKFSLIFPLFLSLSMGLSLHNSIAVIHGYLGRQTPFVRTPKFNIKSLSHKWVAGNNYTASRIPATTIFEGLLCLYFLAAVAFAIYYRDTTFVVFHLLLTFGYGAICYYSLAHHMRLSRSAHA